MLSSVAGFAPARPLQAAMRVRVATKLHRASQRLLTHTCTITTATPCPLLMRHTSALYRLPGPHEKVIEAQYTTLHCIAARHTTLTHNTVQHTWWRPR